MYREKYVTMEAMNAMKAVGLPCEISKRTAMSVFFHLSSWIVLSWMTPCIFQWLFIVVYEKILLKQAFVSDYKIPSARIEQESQNPLQVNTEYDQASLAFDSKFLKRLNKVSDGNPTFFGFILLAT
jgi:hypothetical protein